MHSSNRRRFGLRSWSNRNDTKAPCLRAPIANNLERSNAESVHPLLQRVVATPFFSHYAISLCSECELWQDDPLCVLRNCSVCPCGEEGGGPEAPDWAVTGADAVTYASRSWQLRRSNS